MSEIRNRKSKIKRRCAGIFLCFLISDFWFPISGYAASVKIYFSSGTGFFVGRDGYVLTNLHVVTYCQRLTVHGAVSEREAKIIARDSEHDLALLKVQGMAIPVGEFRPMPLVKGDRVVIVGYPGDSGMKNRLVTREAIVVSPTGPAGEDRWIQLSDVLEQGNSGGPLLDGSGNVAGVITAKAVITSYRSDQPQNVTTRNAGVAVSLPVVQRFLENNRVRWQEAAEGVDLMADSVTDKARRFVVHVKCEYKTEVR